MKSLFQLGLTILSLYGAFTLRAAPTVTVTNLVTQNVRELLQQGDSLRFACDGMVVWSEPLSITGTVSIDATGYEIVFSGGNTSRLFNVFTGAFLALTNITLRDGRHSKGGAIFNEGTVVAHSCRFINNLGAGAPGNNGTNGADGLSADYFSAPFSQVTPGGNGAPGGDGEDSSGGAILNSGSLGLVDCTFENNQANAGSGGKGGNGGSGGRWDRRFVPVDGREGGNAGQPGNPGSAKGGAIASQGVLWMSGCTFSNSIATGGKGGEGGYGGNPGYESSARGVASKGSAGGASYGAALFISGQAFISNSLFISNLSQGGKGGTGGGNNPPAGLFSYPSPREGGNGGIGNGGAISMVGHAFLVNCTVVSNTAFGGGGGDGGRAPAVYQGFAISGSGGDSFGGAFFNGGTASVVNLTISQNAVFGGLLSTQAPLWGFGVSNTGVIGAGHGGSVASTSVLEVANTILAWGSSNNFFGSPVDNGHNLSSDQTPNWSSVTSSNNVDPGLLPLADNGGSTRTMALSANSPARNRANPATSPQTDQRGFKRPRGPGYDIGAYETGVPPLEIILTAPSLHGLRWLAEKDQPYRLEETLVLGDWTILSTNIAASNGWQELKLPVGSTNRFFRLTEP